MSNYIKTQEGFDDNLMRQAVNNVKPKPYQLLDMKNLCANKYNCQDWAEEIRSEYYKLVNQKNLDIWNDTIRSRYNFNH